MIINRTSVYCDRCATSHEATIERHDNEILGRVDCPVGGQRVVLSNDADIFLKIREKSEIRASGGNGCHLASVQNFLIVTNSCNCKCPVCFADAGNSLPFFIPPDEAYELGLRLKRAGGTRICLLGGEPTIHAQLCGIIKKLRTLGLTVVMASNGLVIADDPKYAAALKKSGLSKVDLQFDTFDEGTHLKMRGNTYIQKKINAAHNIMAAGLELGIVMTVTDLNLHEVARIIEYWLAFAPKLNSIALQVVSCTGRYDLPVSKNVNREQVIKEVLKIKTTPAITLEDFWPLPIFKPWNFRIHPDCAASLYLAVNDGMAKPLGAMTDIAAIQTRLKKNAMRANFFSRLIVPLYYAFKETRAGSRLELLSALAGLFQRKGKKGMVLVGVGSFVCTEFQDEQRFSCCPTSIVTRDGFVSPCSYYR